MGRFTLAKPSGFLRLLICLGRPLLTALQKRGRAVRSRTHQPRLRNSDRLSQFGRCLVKTVCLLRLPCHRPCCRSADPVAGSSACGKLLKSRFQSPSLQMTILQMPPCIHIRLIRPPIAWRCLSCLGAWSVSSNSILVEHCFPDPRQERLTRTYRCERWVRTSLLIVCSWKEVHR